MEIPEISTAAIKAPQIPLDQEQKKPLVAPARKAVESAQVLSPLAQIVISHDLEEFNFSTESTRFAFYKQEQNLALKARSQTDIQSKQEKYTFELTFSAESLGLTGKDFEGTGGNPIEFSFIVQQARLQVQQVEATRLVKTLRNPEDILNDLAKALRVILQDRGNKSISYVLDEEARQALMGDPKVMAALSDLVMLMGMINIMKAQGQPATDYTVSVSGKGKPYLDYERYTSVAQEMLQVEYRMTILPPAAAPVSVSNEGKAMNAAPHEDPVTPASSVEGNQI
jgi:hypothetical protein